VSWESYNSLRPCPELWYSSRSNSRAHEKARCDSH